MALKNLFGRGIGFGGPEWIPTRGYSIGAAVATTYVIIGRFKDKRALMGFSDQRPVMAFKDKRPRMQFSMPEVDDG